MVLLDQMILLDWWSHWWSFQRSFWHKSEIRFFFIDFKRSREKGKLNLEVLKPSVFSFESMFSSMFQKCHVSHCSWIWDFQRFIEQVHPIQVHQFRPSYWLNTVQLKNTRLSVSLRTSNFVEIIELVWHYMVEEL